MDTVIVIVGKVQKKLHLNSNSKSNNNFLFNFSDCSNIMETVDDFK